MDEVLRSTLHEAVPGRLGYFDALLAECDEHLKPSLASSE